MFQVAIDGPAGAGKSSIAKMAAKELSFIYVDTGALYRAVGYYVFNHGVSDDSSESAITDLLHDIKVELRFVDGEQKVYLNDEDVSEIIRKNEVSMYASKVSAIPKVRSFLFDLQRSIAEKNNVIMDGRDIGTVVLPDAQVKIYLTATPEERALRRCKELTEKGFEVQYDTLLEEIKQRDYNDMNRKISPLKQAVDAVLLDTTHLNINESANAVIDLIKNKYN